MHFHSKQVWNKRRTNKNGKLVRGRHFEHEKINAQIMRDVFEKKILPWCQENGLELLIMDNDPKLHCKSVVTFMAENGVQIYPGSGKNPWVSPPVHRDFQFIEDREENGYPPRSHDCQPEETEFAQDFELAQEDLERREKNAKHKRTMHMWKNALEHVWNTRPIEPTQKLIDRMPKVMKAIIETEGGKAKY